MRLARDLERAVGSFDRAVLGYLKFDTPTSNADVGEAASDLLATLAEYQRIGEPETGSSPTGRYVRTSRHSIAMV